MNAKLFPKHPNTELSREAVEQSFTYKADLYDVNIKASEVLGWISTLLTEAKRTSSEEVAKTLIDIAQYLSDDQANVFSAEQQRLEKLLGGD